MNNPVIIGDATLFMGDCLEVLPTLDAGSVDSIVTDPPYGLGFMGKDWDHGVPGVHFWTEALRVAKPGAHLLAFGGTRTYHRLACAIEDAGWEIRDQIQWLYGSGFPKSLDVSKAIDKAAGVEPVGYLPNPAERPGNGPQATTSTGWAKPSRPPKPIATSDAAVQWSGWGTALKPANEPIVVARKPFKGTVAANVLANGAGGLNIDGCRVGTETAGWNGANGSQQTHNASKYGGLGAGDPRLVTGRWPANVVHDGSDEVAGLFPQTGSGSAARFFYCSKCSRKDRDEGMGKAEAKRDADRSKPDGPGGDNPRNRTNNPRRNHHPTVKPTELMRWLVRLVTPPGGVVLDPFTGSGSTGKACAKEGVRFLGIELESEYFDIACKRIEDAMTGGPLLAQGETQ